MGHHPLHFLLPQAHPHLNENLTLAHDLYCHSLCKPFFLNMYLEKGTHVAVVFLLTLLRSSPHSHQNLAYLFLILSSFIRTFLFSSLINIAVLVSRWVVISFSLSLVSRRLFHLMYCFLTQFLHHTPLPPTIISNIGIKYTYTYS